MFRAKLLGWGCLDEDVEIKLLGQSYWDKVIGTKLLGQSYWDEVVWMRILFLGDVMGRSAREKLQALVPQWRKKWALDFVIVNVENAAGGFGVTKKICDAFLKAGIDVMSSGNHIWDQKETRYFIDDEPRLLRPVNFPPQTQGKGVGLYTNKNGKTILVINVMGQYFMQALNDPFQAVEKELSVCQLGRDVDAILVDVHGEASSEKMAMGHFCDGRASVVVGTHTHIPTADVMILPKGTAYQTDAGMCGDYDSVIGMDKVGSLHRFIKKMRDGSLEAAQGEPTLCGLYVETDDKTGLAKKAKPIRLGGCLPQADLDW